VEVGGKTADGEFSLEHVFCLGNCALSPSVQMDETLHGRVTIERIESLCREARS
jgi:formate dehydrogenase subunit gamma